MTFNDQEYLKKLDYIMKEECMSSLFENKKVPGFIEKKFKICNILFIVFFIISIILNIMSYKTNYQYLILSGIFLIILLIYKSVVLYDYQNGHIIEYILFVDSIDKVKSSIISRALKKNISITSVDIIGMFKKNKNIDVEEDHYMHIVTCKVIDVNTGIVVGEISFNKKYNYIYENSFIRLYTKDTEMVKKMYGKEVLLNYLNVENI